MAGRLNLLCVDNTPNGERVFSWYFQQHHRRGDEVGLVHLYSLPGLNFMFDDDNSRNNGVQAKNEMDAILMKVKEVKDKFKTRCIEQMNVTPQIFFENATDTHGKIICQIAEKSSASMLVMSQAGTRLSGSKSGPDFKVARYLVHNCKSPVLIVPAANMPSYVEEATTTAAALINTQDNYGDEPGRGGLGGRGPRGGGPAPLGQLSSGPPGQWLEGPLGPPSRHGEPASGPMMRQKGSGASNGGRYNPMARPVIDDSQYVEHSVPADVKGPPYIVYAYFGGPVSENDLFKHFGPYGGISKVDAKSDKGFGFVHFYDYFEAMQAVVDLNGAQIPNSRNRMQVTIKKKKDSKPAEPIPDGVKGPPYIVYCYVGCHFTKDDVYAIFAKYGRIQAVHGIHEKGFAFIHFGDYHEAAAAVKATNGEYIQHVGRKVQVMFKTEGNSETEKHDKS